MIDEARQFVAATINTGLTMLYWRIGKRVNEEILQGKRAGYGKEIIVTLSRELVVEYGNNFAEKNLRNMLRFAEAFPDDQIVYALSRQLSWTHFRTIIYLDDQLNQDFLRLVG